MGAMRPLGRKGFAISTAGWLAATAAACTGAGEAALGGSSAGVGCHRSEGRIAPPAAGGILICAPWKGVSKWHVSYIVSCQHCEPRQCKHVQPAEATDTLNKRMAHAAKEPAMLPGMQAQEAVLDSHERGHSARMSMHCSHASSAWLKRSVLMHTHAAQASLWHMRQHHCLQLVCRQASCLMQQCNCTLPHDLLCQQRMHQLRAARHAVVPTMHDMAEMHACARGSCRRAVRRSPSWKLWGKASPSSTGSCASSAARAACTRADDGILGESPASRRAPGGLSRREGRARMGASKGPSSGSWSKPESMGRARGRGGSAGLVRGGGLRRSELRLRVRLRAEESENLWQHHAAVSACCMANGCTPDMLHMICMRLWHKWRRSWHAWLTTTA